MSSFKINENHIRVFLEFMEENPDLAKGRLSCSNARDKFRQLWSQLAVNLNSLGYGSRTVEKWQRTWSDYKLGLKRRASDNKKESMKTGGGPTYSDKLSQNDERALALLGNTFFEGCGVEEIGSICLQFSQRTLNTQGERNTESSASLCQTDSSASLVSPKISMANRDVEVVPPSACLDDLISARPGPSEKREFKEQQHHPARSRKRQLDHDYLPKPRRKIMQTSSISQYYEETIDLLKSIDRRLGNLDETLKEKLDSISDAIRHKNI